MHKKSNADFGLPKKKYMVSKIIKPPKIAILATKKFKLLSKHLDLKKKKNYVTI